jgi:hypothetical protein
MRCAHTQHTHRRPSRVVNPTVFTAKAVSRAAAVELFTAYVSPVSLLRISSFVKFSKFQDFGGKKKIYKQSFSLFVVFALNISPCFVPFDIKVPIRVSEIRQCKLKNWKELCGGCEKRKPKIKER